MEAQLRNAIANEISLLGANAPALMSRARVEKLYEIFVLSCLARALRQLGAVLSPRDSSDRPTSNLVFRLGPGLIWAPTSAPGFIHVSYKGQEYEIQNGVRVLGVSKVLHELDVCLIERNEAVRCRRNRINPVQARIKFLAECKYYGDSLPLGLGREYLGLSSEFSLRIKTIVSNVSSDEIHNLVTKHKGTENFEVSMIKPNNIEQFVQWLANELRQVLG
jgi:hypothetical protein